MPRILNHGTVWRRVVTPWPFYASPPPRRDMPVYTLNRRMGGPHSPSGRFGEEKISCRYRESNHDPSVIQSTAYSLCQLYIAGGQGCGVGVRVMESESESEGILGGVGVGRNFRWSRSR
jgi:hypothetical protein